MLKQFVQFTSTETRGMKHFFETNFIERVKNFFLSFFFFNVEPQLIIITLESQ